MSAPKSLLLQFLLVIAICFPVICKAEPVQSISATSPTGLDISLTAASAGYSFYPGASPTWGNLQPGGFIQFDLAVASAGAYSLNVYYSTTLANQSANILINGAQQQVVQLPDTQSWGSPQNSSPVSVNLPAGKISLTIAAVSSAPAFNIQGMTLTPVPASSSVPVMALSSTSPTGLNVALVTASGNYSLSKGTPPVWGNLQTGGFLKYTLSSAQTQNFEVALYYSTTLNGMSGSLLVDGNAVATSSLPSTGSWSTFQNSAQVLVTIPAGTSTLSIAAVGTNPAFNLQGITLTPASNIGEETSSSYPFAGKKLYVNAYTVSAQNPNACAAISPNNPTLMTKIATQPQSVWFGNWNTNVESDAQNLVNLAAAQGAMPSIVVYNIPDRDCAGGYSSGGADDPAYKTWVQQLAQGLGSAKVGVILEPDALTQINECNMTSQQQQDRYSLLQYAVSMFKTFSPNASVYIDAGHADDSIAASDMAQRLQNAGVSSAVGFALNTSYYGTTASNVSYGQSISALLGNQHFVIDTGRNGNGPTPDAQWCNPSGRALGSPPQGLSSGLVDAYLWVKNPGESDGTCNGGPPAGQLFPQMACTLAGNATW